VKRDVVRWVGSAVCVMRAEGAEGNDERFSVWFAGHKKGPHRRFNPKGRCKYRYLSRKWVSRVISNKGVGDFVRETIRDHTG
jgi:hypothetical protein